MKQALVEGAEPIPEISMYEQGQGKLNLVKSKVGNPRELLSLLLCILKLAMLCLFTACIYDVARRLGTQGCFCRTYWQTTLRERLSCPGC